MAIRTIGILASWVRVNEPMPMLVFSKIFQVKGLSRKGSSKTLLRIEYHKINCQKANPGVLLRFRAQMQTKINRIPIITP
jgi:hypothetical protein